jgi:hypothetical protein
MSQRLPRFFARQLQHEDTRRIDRVVAEAGASEPVVVRSGAQGGDVRRMRGVPIVVRGVPGTRDDADPWRSLANKERSRSRGGR